MDAATPAGAVGVARRQFRPESTVLISSGVSTTAETRHSRQLHPKLLITLCLIVVE
jgi:hypothetical protein